MMAVSGRRSWLLAAALLMACQSQAEAPVSPLVDAAWLADHLDEVVVVDLRNDPGEDEEPDGYAVGHVPGAVHAPYGTTPWRVERAGVRGLMPSRAEMEGLLGFLGISADDHVVIVSSGWSSGDMATATRVYWQLKVVGHERLSILDGGYAGWAAAELPSETSPNEPVPVRYTGSWNPELLASVADVEAALQGGTTLVDARTPVYFRGEDKSGSVARPGTLPGARNTSHAALVADGRFVDAETAATIWSDAGVGPGDEQITFCNTGQLASLAWFVSHEILGNDDARLYDGSLTEWASDDSRPMQTTSPEG